MKLAHVMMTNAGFTLLSQGVADTSGRTRASFLVSVRVGGRQVQPPQPPSASAL